MTDIPHGSVWLSLKGGFNYKFQVKSNEVGKGSIKALTVALSTLGTKVWMRLPVNSKFSLPYI